MTFDRHQQLVLHMGEACGLRLVLTPALELPQRDAELQEPLELLPGSACGIVTFQASRTVEIAVINQPPSDTAR